MVYPNYRSKSTKSCYTPKRNRKEPRSRITGNRESKSTPHGDLERDPTCDKSAACLLEEPYSKLQRRSKATEGGERRPGSRGMEDGLRGYGWGVRWRRSNGATGRHGGGRGLQRGEARSRGGRRRRSQEGGGRSRVVVSRSRVWRRWGARLVDRGDW